MSEVSDGAEIRGSAFSFRARVTPVFFFAWDRGLITGAADDDPSGIATYSQVGAQFGMGMLWTCCFSFPSWPHTGICGRLGRITGAGIAENLRDHYPRPVLYGIVFLLSRRQYIQFGCGRFPRWVRRHNWSLAEYQTPTRCCSESFSLISSNTRALPEICTLPEGG